MILLDKVETAVLNLGTAVLISNFPAGSAQGSRWLTKPTMMGIFKVHQQED